MNKKHCLKAEHNPQKIIDRYVHARLREWANWCVKCTVQGLGYPTRSVEGRLRDDGGVLPKSTAPLQLPTHPRAEEMEMLITEMGAYDAALLRAIRMKYLDKNTLYHEAKVQKISLPTLKNDLRRAKTWLAAKLNVNVMQMKSDD